MQALTADLATQIQQQQRLTAVGISVCHRGESVGLATAGARRKKAAVPVTDVDKWHIGSITKPITATLIARLVDDGALDFEARLPEVLPAIAMHESWTDCSLEHLLTHTARLPGNFPFKAQKIWPDDAAELVAARRRLIAEVLAKPAKGPCGSKFAYSNIGYTIAGHIAESAKDEPYEALVQKNVFNPLNLSSAGFGAPIGQSSDDQPVGHRTLLGFRKAMNPFEGQADNGPIISAAGRAHMNLNDLTLFGCAHLQGSIGNNDFLKPHTWKRLHKPNMNDYACGWVNHARDWAGGAVLWHNGSNTMWYALLTLLPKKEAVFAFVTNDGSIRKAEKAFVRAAEQLANALPV